MKPLVSLALVFLMTACRSATEPTAGDPFEVPLHEARLAVGSPFIVAFDSVLEDSRCPIGAMCIWEGRAAVQVSVTYQTGPDILFQVRLSDRPDSSIVTIQGWWVEYVNLLPRPSIGEPQDPDTTRRLVLRVRPIPPD